MIVVENLTSLGLFGGDKVATATTFRDYVLIVTERGYIFKIYHKDRP